MPPPCEILLDLWRKRNVTRQSCGILASAGATAQIIDRVGLQQLADAVPTCGGRADISARRPKDFF
jgi:hypothetical protein